MTKKPFTNIDGLVVRPSRETDSTFLQTLYHSARPDLQLIDGERDQVEDVIAQQFRVQDLGLGEHFPNAMHYVVEKLGTPIGALVTDFGHNEIRVLYLAFIPAARGKGMAVTLCKACSRPPSRYAARSQRWSGPTTPMRASIIWRWGLRFRNGTWQPNG